MENKQDTISEQQKIFRVVFELIDLVCKEFDAGSLMGTLAKAKCIKQPQKTLIVYNEAKRIINA